MQSVSKGKLWEPWHGPLFLFLAGIRAAMSETMVSPSDMKTTERRATAIHSNLCHVSKITKLCGCKPQDGGGVCYHSITHQKLTN